MKYGEYEGSFNSSSNVLSTAAPSKMGNAIPGTYPIR